MITLERKRALPQSAFGNLLSSLISAPAPTKPLRPLHPPPSAEAQEKRALKQLQAKKHEREERGHVADVIAGWTPRPNTPFSQWNRIDLETLQNDGSANPDAQSLGGAEKEKELRRLAQRGAVRLFNAIKAAQSTEASGATTPAIAASSSGTARLAAIKNDAAAAGDRKSVV